MAHAYPADLAEFARARWTELMRTSGRSTERGSAALPPPRALEHLLSVAYQASLLYEENRPVKVRLFIGEPEAVPGEGGPPTGLHRLRFIVPRPYEDHEIRRLSPAAKYHRALIGVRLAGGEQFEIWGVLQSGPRWMQSARGGRFLASPVPNDALVVRVPGAGRIAINYGEVSLGEIRGGQLLGRPMDVFESRVLRTRFRRFRAELLAECQAELPSAVDSALDPEITGAITVQMVKRLVSTIRESHNGATIVFLPQDRAERLLYDHRAIRLKYTFADEEPRRRYRTLMLAVMRELIANAAEASDSARRADKVGFQTYQTSTLPSIAALDEAILEMSQLLAGLGDVDGAVVLTECFDLLGFGGEIGGNLPEISSVRQARDLEGTEYDVVPVDGVGTRHRSAYRLCAHEKEAFAIVASHDGGVQFVTWHEGAPMVWEHVPSIGAAM